MVTAVVGPLPVWKTRVPVVSAVTLYAVVVVVDAEIVLMVCPYKINQTEPSGTVIVTPLLIEMGPTDKALYVVVIV